jgi:hypothetical protein
MNTKLWVLGLGVLVLALARAEGSEPDLDKAPPKVDDVRPAEPPAGEAGARAVLSAFLKPGADPRALTKPLVPTSADYLAAFQQEFAAKAEAYYAPLWSKGLVVFAKSDQTELLLSSATSKDFQAWNEKANMFPGGYKKVKDVFQPGVVIYRFKFVKAGDHLGMAYDGLVHVNGHWRIFPKPWRVLDPRRQPK